MPRASRMYRTCLYCSQLPRSFALVRNRGRVSAELTFRKLLAAAVGDCYLAACISSWRCRACSVSTCLQLHTRSYLTDVLWVLRVQSMACTQVADIAAVCSASQSEVLQLLDGLRTLQATVHIKTACSRAFQQLSLFEKPISYCFRSVSANFRRRGRDDWPLSTIATYAVGQALKAFL